MNRKLYETLERLRESLMADANAQGVWEGRLSSSPLATAIAIRTLREAGSPTHQEAIEQGEKWVTYHQNKDGGWGDTIRSRSDLTATLLVYCALLGREESLESQAKAKEWLAQEMGGFEPDIIVSAVLNKYGDDRTFSAPILTVCAIAGILGDDASAAWRLVPQLPFELAAFPHQLFSLLKLSVVSYALPALIAIGLVRHRNRPSRNPLAAWLRNLFTGKLLTALTAMQPEHGGFLEATPLTGFVTISLVHAGCREHQVTERGLAFLTDSQRPDGSWPIDTNLATWLTTLTVSALTVGNDCSLDAPRKEQIRTWLLEQQFTEVHPFTHASPGGWGWTDLPGAVPDADDTAGALLALSKLGEADEQTLTAVRMGIHWLLDIQNTDGGFPTFCKGWGRLPFDRSCPDITAHVLLALVAWKGAVDEKLRTEIAYTVGRGLDYLQRSQQGDGSWVPLWFGNERMPALANPTYGTGTVLAALHQLDEADLHKYDAMISDATKYLVAIQNPDGGWGSGPRIKSSLEETGIATYALAISDNMRGHGIHRAVNWLCDNRHVGPAPIGLYFASLWYYEKLYPVIFATRALAAVDALDGEK
ncbi:hypothetical protein BVY04_03835 [bacterium M21]|nr:hypothetical protein BVY04_03835 [bacterium M21]